MECSNCGQNIPVNKRLQRGKARTPDECPTCGETLEKEDTTGVGGDLIQK